jgi:hypothetical protein
MVGIRQLSKDTGLGLRRIDSCTRASYPQYICSIWDLLSLPRYSYCNMLVTEVKYASFESKSSLTASPRQKRFGAMTSFLKFHRPSAEHERPSRFLGIQYTSSVSGMMTSTFSPIRACIFDVDGTLVNTEDIYTDIYNNILREYGRPDYCWKLVSLGILSTCMCPP